MAFKRTEKREVEYYDEPEGTTVFEISDKAFIQAEVGEFNEMKNFSLRKWILTNKGWIRTGQGFTVPRSDRMTLLEGIVEYTEELKERQSKRRR